MEPTLRAGDIVAIVPTSLASVERGDIVAIDWWGWTGDPGPDAPMRVIGVASDNIELRGGRVLLNGSVLNESYVAHGQRTEPMPNTRASDWVVPQGSIFVLGDSRTSAADSRAYGFVPNEAVLGSVSFRCGPPERRGPIG